MISPLIDLWCVAAGAFAFHLICLPARQRFSHPGTLVGGAFLLVLLDGPVNELRLANGVLGGGLFYPGYLLSAMKLNVLAFVLFLIGCNIPRIYAAPQPSKTSAFQNETIMQERVMNTLTASVVCLQAFYYFQVLSFGKILMGVSGGRHEAFALMNGEDTPLVRYGTIVVTLASTIALIWCSIRPISLGKFNWRPVSMSIIPLLVGIITSTRGAIFQVGAPLALVYVLFKPNLRARHVLLPFFSVSMFIFFITAFRAEERYGVVEFIRFVVNFDFSNVVSVDSMKDFLGGAVGQTTSAMYLVERIGTMGWSQLLVQFNPIPTFISGRVGNELWFQQALGISQDAVGITVPVLPDLYLDTGWWAVLFYLPLGVFLNRVYSQVVRFREEGMQLGPVFPAWVIFYTMCIFGCLLMWHQSVRGLYRTFFNAAILCYGLHFLLTRFQLAPVWRATRPGGRAVPNSLNDPNVAEAFPFPAD